MIAISDKASQRIQSLLKDSSKPAEGLRVKIVGGGCSGLSYKMELDAKRDGDKIIEYNGAKLLVDKKSFLYLNNSLLDFKDSLQGAGFYFTNPNAKRTCGCGESFSV